VGADVCTRRLLCKMKDKFGTSYGIREVSRCGLQTAREHGITSRGLSKTKRMTTPCTCFVEYAVRVSFSSTCLIKIEKEMGRYLCLQILSSLMHVANETRQREQSRLIESRSYLLFGESKRPYGGIARCPFRHRQSRSPNSIIHAC